MAKQELLVTLGKKESKVGILNQRYLQLFFFNYECNEIFLKFI